MAELVEQAAPGRRFDHCARSLELGTHAQGLPSHPLQELSLCSEDLQRAARRAMGKAAGADGWQRTC